MAFNVLCLNLLWSSLLTLCTPFRIISASMAASMQYSFSVHLAFEEGRPALALWYSTGWILFSWMCLPLTVANFSLQKSQRTCFLRAPEGVSFFFLNQFTPATVYKLHPIRINLHETTFSITCNISSTAVECKFVKFDNLLRFRKK